MKSKGNRLKKPVVEMIIIMACGIFLISISLGLIFGVYRPFVPWQKITCTWIYEDDGSGNTYERADDKNMTFIYRFTLDGTFYEVPLKEYVSKHSGINDDRIVYVNRNNPYEAKAGNYGTLFLVALLILLTGGAGTVAFAFVNYRAKTCGKRKNKGKKKQR